ncbi:MAG: hypothetical protein ACJ8R9_10960 [Steroidobacteraceae bacterium]
MTQPQDGHMFKHILDIASAALAGLTVIHALPYIAAGLSIVWWAMRYYEKFTGKVLGKRSID